jgi:hypothetical protein
MSATGVIITVTLAAQPPAAQPRDPGAGRLARFALRALQIGGKQLIHQLCITVQFLGSQFAPMKQQQF